MNNRVTKPAAVMAILMATTISAFAYPKVTIKNTTKFSASGEVNYPGCRNDKFTVAPGKTWTGPYRGGCLITWITASLSGGPSVVKYTSSGTGYSEFVIGRAGVSYEVYSTKGGPSAPPLDDRIASRPFFVVAHMVTTAKAVDWAVSQGANGLEVDLQFDRKTGRPTEFRHGGVCDCICWPLTRQSDHVCKVMGTDCEIQSTVEGHLRHIARKSSVAMVIIDSKLDTSDHKQPVQQAAGIAVVKSLEQNLFGQGYRGFVVVSCPESAFINTYLKSAVAQAAQSKYRNRLYFSVDMDNGGANGANATITSMRKNLATRQLIYGCGISACAPGSYTPEVKTAVQRQLIGDVCLSGIWTLDSEDSMKKYINIGARGIITNRPGALARVAGSLSVPLAKAGYFPEVIK